LFALNLPFPLVVLGAGALGMAAAAWRPELLALKDPGESPPQAPRPWGYSLRTIAIWGVLWAAPLLAVFLILGPDHVLWKIGTFFSQLAVVTFGGAYAVLAYMAQQAVQGFGWLSPGEMADGLGMAETTPGPLIMVTQFVSYLAAYRDAAPFTPLLAGILGALLTTWVTFVPCFLWIFTFAPWIERLEHARRPDPPERDDGDHLGRDLGLADGADRVDAGDRSRALADRRILFEACRGNLWRCLCRAVMDGAGGGAAIRLAHPRRNGRCPGAG
ncbi:MAG: chromate transporter, partial [Novosphingobium sp.]